MKKAFYAILAALTIIGMVSCGGGNKKSEVPDVTITFSIGTLPAGYTGPTPVAPQPVTFKSGGTLTAAQINTGPTGGAAGLEFQGWFLENGASKLTVNSTFGANTTVVARWTWQGAAAQVTVTFNVNLPTGYAGTTPTAPDPQTITAGTGLSATVLNTAPANADADLLFLGWFAAASGGTRLTATNVFNASATIYAQWTVLAANDIVITFKYNYGAGSADIASEPADYTAVTQVGVAIPAANWPADPTRTGYTFSAWKQYAGGGGDTYTVASTSWPDGNGGSTKDTVWALWVPVGGPVVENPPDTIDLTGVEKVTLGNQALVIYAFNLPTGKEWSDYTAITAQIMVGPAQWEKTVNHWRLLGNYKISDFSLGTVKLGANAGKKLAIAGFKTGGTVAEGNKYAPYIFDQVAAYNNGAKKLNEILTDLGQTTAEPWKWFTKTHSLINNNPHDNFKNDPNKPLPDATATGPFYFGIGLPGSGETGFITQYIKDVTLVGAAGTSDLKGIPLRLTYDDGTGDYDYPVFAGWAPFDGGDNGIQFAASEPAKAGETITPVKLQAKITFNLEDGTNGTIIKKVLKGDALSGTTAGGLTTFPADPVWGAKVFSSWNTAANGSGTTVTSSTTFSADNTNVYAVWVDKEITITFNAVGGTLAAGTPASVTIGENGVLGSKFPADPSYVDHIFDGWYKDAAYTAGKEVDDATAFGSDDATIYAKWINAYTITFKYNSGAPDKVILIAQQPGGSVIPAANFPANPTRAYFDFTGWNLLSTGKGLPVTNTTKYAKNTTVYATWKNQVLAPADLVYLSTDTTIGDATTIRTAIQVSGLGQWGKDSLLHWKIADLGIPAGYDLASYDRFTIKVKAYSDAAYTTEIDLTDSSVMPKNTNLLQFKFTRDETSLADTVGGVNVIASVTYNIGVWSDGTPPAIYGDKWAIPAVVLNAPASIKAIFLQGGGDIATKGVGSIEVTDIIFHTALSGAVGINLDDTTFADPLYPTITDQVWKVSTGDLAITVPAGYTSYRWLLNGTDQGVITNTLNLSVKDFTNRINTKFTVTAIAEDSGGKKTSKTIVITVNR